MQNLSLNKPWVWLLINVAFWMSNDAYAQTSVELQEIQFSGDIDHTLPATGGGALVSNDDTIVMFDLSTGTADSNEFLGNLDNADIDAYHDADNCSDRVFSLDASVEINNTTMRPADVFNSTGNKTLDAQTEGIADGINIDAISFDPATCDLVFSVDIHTELDGTVFAPDDLIAWNDNDGFRLFLAGGMDADIDAVHLLDIENRVLFSTAVDVEIGGSIFQDEDIIERVPGVPDTFFELSFSPSPFDPTWEPTDLDALWVMRTPLSGVFHWETSDVEVFEDAGSISVMIVRTAGNEGSIDVSWNTIADTATAGADFVDTSNVLTLGDGVSSGIVMVNLLDDAAVEGTEEFIIRITAVSDGSIGTPQDIRVIIRDDEDFIFADGYEG